MVNVTKREKGIKDYHLPQKIAHEPTKKINIDVRIVLKHGKGDIHS